MKLDLNEIVSAALNEAIQETLQPVVYEISALRKVNKSLEGQLKTLQDLASNLDRDLTEAQDQIQMLKENPPASGVDYSGEAFVSAVEALAERQFSNLIDVALEGDDFTDAIKAVADERINRKMAGWTELPEFEDGIKEVVKEWFEDEIEVKDLIEPAVELVLEDVDFDDKIREALVNNVSLRVIVE